MSERGHYLDLRDGLFMYIVRHANNLSRYNSREPRRDCFKPACLHGFGPIFYLCNPFGTIQILQQYCCQMSLHSFPSVSIRMAFFVAFLPKAHSQAPFYYRVNCVKTSMVQVFGPHKNEFWPTSDQVKRLHILPFKNQRGSVGPL